MSEDMVTVTIQLGNSDDKLSQREWSDFILNVSDWLNDLGKKAQVHFAGGSAPERLWQNYCFVANLSRADSNELYHFLGAMARRYNQAAIGLTIGQTEFVRSHIEFKEQYVGGAHVR